MRRFFMVRQRPISLLLVVSAFMAGCTPPRLPQTYGPIDLVIAATTDVHGHVRGWDYDANAPDTLRGLSRAATIIDSLRRVSAAYPVVVDAGDFLEGTRMASLAASAGSAVENPIVAAMNVVQYDAVAIGSHDFSFGVPTLERASHQAHFPLVAANVYRPDGTPRFRPWVVSTRRGVKIAIVGATTPGVMVWARDTLAGRLVVHDAVPDVRAAVQQARDAGAAVVIVIAHSGLNEPSSYDTVATGVPSENVAARLAHEVPGIDLIVYGHSHREMADTTIGTTLLMQPGARAASVGVAHLRVERRRGRWQVIARRSTVVASAHHKEDAKVVAVTQQAHRAAQEYRSNHK